MDSYSEKDFPERHTRIKRIGLFSLSGIADKERIERGIATLSAIGFEAIFPHPANKTLRYLEATDSERLRMFNELLERPDVDAMMSLRGGFGVTRVLEDIDWELLRRRDIPLIGYSDVSALLLAAYSRGCTRLIHGPMLCSSLAKAHPATIAAFKECLAGKTAPLLPNATPRFIKYGSVTARLFPANLTMLCNLIGTDFMPSLDGCLLAVEDVNEAAYSIDRMLAHLKNAGILKRLSGLVFGQFTDGEDAEYLPEIFSEYSEFVNGPVIVNFPFGHGTPSTSIQVGRLYDTDLIAKAN